MTMFTRGFATLAALGSLLCAPSIAGDPIEVSGVPTGWTLTKQFNSITQKWQITVERPTGNGNTGITVYATEPNQRIAWFRMVRTDSGTGGNDNVMFTSQEERILSIDEITGGTDITLRIGDLDIQDDVGSINNAQYIARARVGGDITGDVELSSYVRNSIIEGDLLGDLHIGGNIEMLEVQGSFGDPGGAARTMRVFGNIWNLTVGEVLDNATILAPGATGGSPASAYSLS